MNVLTQEIRDKILERQDLTTQERKFFSSESVCGTPVGPSGRWRVPLLIEWAKEELAT